MMITKWKNNINFHLWFQLMKIFIPGTIYDDEWAFGDLQSKLYELKEFFQEYNTGNITFYEFARQFKFLSRGPIPSELCRDLHQKGLVKENTPLYALITNIIDQADISAEANTLLQPEHKVLVNLFENILSFNGKIFIDEAQLRRAKITYLQQNSHSTKSQLEMVTRLEYNKQLEDIKADVRNDCLTTIINNCTEYFLNDSFNVIGLTYKQQFDIDSRSQMPANICSNGYIADPFLNWHPTSLRSSEWRYYANVGELSQSVLDLERATLLCTILARNKSLLNTGNTCIRMENWRNDEISIVTSNMIYQLICPNRVELTGLNITQFIADVGELMINDDDFTVSDDLYFNYISLEKNEKDICFQLENMSLIQYSDNMELEIDRLCDEAKAAVNEYGRQLDIFLDQIEHNSNEFLMKNALAVNIFFRDVSVEAYYQLMSYDFWSLLSDIGGAIGLFLGASILTIAEVIDFLLIKMLFETKQNHNNNANVDEKIETQSIAASHEFIMKTICD